MKVYFSDFFEVSPDIIEDYGAFNISVINDLPLFIDPFLLFNSKKEEYQNLHDEIIDYVAFLRDIANENELKPGLLKSWFLFPEIKQNWLGYSKISNGGTGLGIKFAKSLNKNLHTVFSNFGQEEITQGSHLEKLCLIKDGIGRDNISDFTTNLIKDYLLEYTESFAKKYIKSAFLQKHNIRHVNFNYKTRCWTNKEFLLPTINNDFVILTPKDILTKDQSWINKGDMIKDFDDIVASVSNEQLRDEINQYFLRSIPRKPRKKDYDVAASKVINHFPQYIDYYIKYKEDNGGKAQKVSNLKVEETENLFIKNVSSLLEILKKETGFDDNHDNSFEDSYKRVTYLKQVIENNDGYRLFYIKGKPIKRESDLQTLFRLTWFATNSDVNSEVNNGRGPVDYKISNGNKDKTIVEFKLASNGKLKQNLNKQVEIYENANQTNQSIKVILFFDDSELDKTLNVLKDLNLKEGKSLVLIDARNNKISASNVK